MIFDTLQYVDGAGATQEIALKLSNLSVNGGAVKVEFIPRTHAPSEFRITWAQSPETGIAIPFKSRCKIYAGRTSTAGAANTFSAGTILFQGRRWDNEGSASSSRVLTSITLYDVLKEFEKVTYVLPWRYISGGTISTPTYSTFNWPDIVLFQAAPGTTYSPAAVNGTITTWQQIQALVNSAVLYGTGVDELQVQLAQTGTLAGAVWSGGTAPEFSPSYLNWYPVRSAKIMECLNICLRPHPGVYMEVDHTTTPPTLHFRNRANMTAVTLPYKSTDGAGIVHIASDIESLDELVPDNVRLFYKINGTFNGQPVLNYSSDTYPSATNKLLSLDYSIDVTGAAYSETRLAFTSAAFDPTSKTLWRKKVSALKQISEGGQVTNDASAGALAFVDANPYNSSTHPKGIQVIDETGAVIDYSSGHYEFVTDDHVYSWMTLSGGSSALAIKATVKAFFTYDKNTTISGSNEPETLKEHEHHFRVLLTNAPSGTYVLKQTLNTGESIPANLAQNIFIELGGDTGSGTTPQWKLRHEIIQVAADTTTVPTLIKPGKHKLNLSGGDAAWTTMNAVPENVSIELFRSGDGRLVAKHTISCGPVNHLEPGYLVQLMNLFCNRNRSGIDAYQRLTGTTSSSQVDLTSSSPRENSTAAAPVFAKQNVVSLDADDATLTNVVQNDATTGQLSVKQKKTSDGTHYTTGYITPTYIGTGAPAAGTLATGAFYRLYSYYLDITDPLVPDLWICVTEGDKTSSAWYSFTQCS